MDLILLSLMSYRKTLAVKSELAAATRAVRKKFRALRRGLIEFDLQTEKQLKPLVAPLQNIVSTAKNEALAVKQNSGGPLPEFIEPDFLVDWGSAYRDSPGNFVPDTPRGLTFDVNAPSTSSAQTPKSTGEYYPSSAMPNPEEYIFDPETKASFASYAELLGPLSRKYVGSVTAKPSIHDTTYGVKFHQGEHANFLLGNKEVDFDQNDDIHIGSSIFKGTPGLFELLFLKNPSTAAITQKDLDTYKVICNLTNLHRANSDPNGRIRSTALPKYMGFIGKLFPPGEKKKKINKFTRGGGFVRNNNLPYNYVYWDSLDELVKRLELLHAAKAAGNTNLDGEIFSIEEELREAHVIR